MLCICDSLPKLHSVKRTKVTYFLQVNLGGSLPTSTRLENNLLKTVSVMKETFLQGKKVDQETRIESMARMAYLAEKKIPLTAIEEQDVQDSINYFKAFRQNRSNESTSKLELFEFEAHIYAKVKAFEEKNWCEIDAIVRAPANEVLAFYQDVEGNSLNCPTLPKMSKITGSFLGKNNSGGHTQVVLIQDKYNSSNSSTPTNADLNESLQRCVVSKVNIRSLIASTENTRNRRSMTAGNNRELRRTAGDSSNDAFVMGFHPVYLDR